jgi:hypothetical protein
MEQPGGPEVPRAPREKTWQGKALTVLAHKLARAVYYLLTRDTAFDLDKFFKE